MNIQFLQCYHYVHLDWQHTFRLKEKEGVKEEGGRESGKERGREGGREGECEISRNDNGKIGQCLWWLLDMYHEAHAEYGNSTSKSTSYKANTWQHNYALV